MITLLAPAFYRNFELRAGLQSMLDIQRRQLVRGQGQAGGAVVAARVPSDIRLDLARLDVGRESRDHDARTSCSSVCARKDGVERWILFWRLWIFFFWKFLFGYRVRSVCQASQFEW